MRTYIYKSKFIRNGLLTILSTIAFSSCTNTFLDLDSQNSVPGDQAIVDTKSAVAGLNGAYSRLQSNLYYGGDEGFMPASYLSGDNVSWTGSLDYCRYFGLHNYRSDNTIISNAWNTIFGVINQANQVIDRTGKLTNISETEKNRIIGEALFIRALAHFDLARAWGNIPIVTKPTNSINDNKDVLQSTASEVYAHVIKDLEEALTLLPEGDVNRNKATKASTNALLARVYLYQGNWEKAEEKSSLLIGDSNYSLIDFPLFFTNKNTEESILELNYTAAHNNTHWRYWLLPADGGRREWAPSDALISLLENPEIGGTRKALIKNTSSDPTRPLYIGVQYHSQLGDDPAYILRISEQYLIRAEARVKKTNADLQGALSDLDAVRLRAKVAVSNAKTKDEIILAIENERRVEFPFEPHRWYDLVRTGRATSVLSFTDTNKQIFPIPYSDIEADGALRQNSSY